MTMTEIKYTLEVIFTNDTPNLVDIVAVPGYKGNAWETFIKRIGDYIIALTIICVHVIISFLNSLVWYVVVTNNIII